MHLTEIGCERRVTVASSAILRAIVDEVDHYMSEKMYIEYVHVVSVHTLFLFIDCLSFIRCSMMMFVRISVITGIEDACPIVTFSDPQSGPANHSWPGPPVLALCRHAQ